MERGCWNTGAAGPEAGRRGVRQGRQEAAEPSGEGRGPWASQLPISAACVLRSKKHSVLCGQRSWTGPHSELSGDSEQQA